MNLPIPPTDNLYKFAAITGTLIVLISLYVPRIMIERLEEQNDALTLKMSTIEAELSFFERRFNTFKNIIDNTIKMQKGLLKISDDKIDMTYSESEIKSMILQLEELDKSLKVSRSEMSQCNNKLKRIIRDVQETLVLGKRGVVFGFIFAFIGFLCWYFKIQIYQDRVLKLSANSTRPESDGQAPAGRPSSDPVQPIDQPKSGPEAEKKT